MREPIEQEASSKQPASATASPSSLRRMRCPSCRKLYTIGFEAVTQTMNDFASSQPKRLRFECVACYTQFAVLAPKTPNDLHLETEVIEPRDEERLDPREDEGIGPSQRAAIERIPLREALHQSPRQRAMLSERECPKCGTINSLSSPECRSCGVVFARYQPVEAEAIANELQLAGRLDLIELWKEVLADYEKIELHEKFIASCQQSEALQFASHKYARVLAAAPDEAIAIQMRKRIVALASAHFESRAASGARATSGGVNFRIPGFNSLVILFSSFVLVLGLMLPGMSNLTGIGASMLALALAVRFVLRRAD